MELKYRVYDTLDFSWSIMFVLLHSVANELPMYWMGKLVWMQQHSSLLKVK